MAIGLDGSWLSKDQCRDKEHVEILIKKDLNETGIAAVVESVKKIKGVFNVESSSARNKFFYMATLKGKRNCDKIAADIRKVSGVEEATFPGLAFPQ